MDGSTDKIERLQEWRARRKKELRVDQVMNTFCRSLRKASKQLIQLQDAWLELVPKHINQVSMPIALQNGTLEVVVDAAPTAYQVNRLIRGTLLRELQTRCSGTLVKIKVRVE
ncbi:MAG: DciA family protein [Phycisphaerales bacterium]|jgi:hypothetical protein|nr:DUF721 domain-containing protein [Phycisphaerae bacterium]MBT5409524.1 DUF721 domain-containing protein [Phycisphaerae bacterium]MBT6164999.1 DUF721 domain-containing protein [Phycisphaerae bacterium]MBT7657046.1 DUF721 domain-containing protein [Phycisphaerae bacterium]MDE1038058.1 DciA family protein [Phycisphaerales bacterium]|tara:strand:+ start:901 stop:1239 length:339 start_codon:yes stop_codon:yes gene_type:complete